MYCYKCGEDNPDEAKYCKNCGTLLKKEETAKKVEVIEAPITNQSTDNNYHKSTTNTSSKSSDGSSNWIGCCLCLIGIFIIFAIMGLF